MLRTILLFSLLFCSFQTLANNSFAPRKINEIVLHDTGIVLIILKDGLSTAEACEKNSYLVLYPSNPLFEPMYSALLAAFHADTYVDGWVNGCNARFKSPILTRLDLTK